MSKEMSTTNKMCTSCVLHLNKSSRCKKKKKKKKNLKNKSLILCVCSLFKTLYILKLSEYAVLTPMVRYVSVVSVKQNALIFVSKLNGCLTSNR